MKKPVFIGVFLASLILAIMNNLLNPQSVAWFGSPEVLAKPTGWPSMSIAEGLLAGFKVGWKEYLAYQAFILIGIGITVVVMFFLNRTRHVRFNPMLRTVIRIGLGLMFLVAAWPKFTDPQGFASLVAQYQFLPAFLVNPFSLFLSAFEIVVALGILFTLWEREFAAMIGLMFLMFIVALAQALLRDLGIACGCFDIEGAQDAGGAWHSLIRDVVLLVPTFWLMQSGGRRYLHWGRNR